MRGNHGNVKGNNENNGIKEINKTVNTLYGSGGDARREALEHAKALNIRNDMMTDSHELL